MGYDAPCTLQVDGRSIRGTAHLEQHDLIFRGDMRLAVPLTSITSARADAGSLTIAWAGRTAVLLIGPHAQKWADRITNPRSRIEKLGVKAGMSVLLIGVETRELAEEIAARGARILARAGAGTADLLFYGAPRRASLERLPALAGAIAQNGAIWIVRPKGRREITESDVMAAARDAGLVDVKVVSFSETHTAEKLVIPVAKRAAPSRPAFPSPRTRGSAASRGRT